MTDTQDTPKETPKVRPCPICKSAAVAAYRPFCSKRCADVDLGKWFKNSYAIAGRAGDDESDSPANLPTNDDGDAH